MELPKYSALKSVLNTYTRGTMTKACKSCQVEKDIACFNKNGRSKDGLSSWCWDCQREYFKAWQEKNYERNKARSRSYYQTHKAEIRHYREANREKRNSYSKAYRDFNREYLNTIRRLRRQRLRAKQDWQLLKQKSSTQGPAAGKHEEGNKDLRLMKTENDSAQLSLIGA